MASVFKRKRDRLRKNSSWFIAYSDENNVRRTVKGCPDKAATEAVARTLESEAELRRRGVIDPKTGLKLDSALTALGQRGDDGAVRNQSASDVMADSHASLLKISGSQEIKAKAAPMRQQTARVGMIATSGSVSAAGARPGLQNR